MVWNWRGLPLHGESRKMKTYKLKAKLLFSREGVGGVHSTKDYADNKTAYREGTLLHSSFQRR